MEDPKFCLSSENCICNKALKNQYFVNLERFGVHIEIEKNVVTFICNRSASKGNNIFKRIKKKCRDLKVTCFKYLFRNSFRESYSSYTRRSFKVL